MIRIYIAVAGVVIFILGLSFYTLSAFSATAGQMLQGLDRLDEAVASGDWDTATDSLGIIQRDWKKHKQWWAVFIDHQEIDNIDTAMARAEKYIENQETTLTTGELAVLRLMLEHIPEKDQVNLQNIF